MNLPTVLVFLIVAAFVCACVSAAGKMPVWVAVILLCVAQLLVVLPK